MAQQPDVPADPGSQREPVYRPTARVMPVSAAGEVLLLLDQDPGEPGTTRWGSIGGALDPGETLSDAAVREMFEETGIRIAVADLVGPFHQDQREFVYDGIRYLGESQFLAVVLDPAQATVSFENLEPAEVGNVFEARWWTPEDLARDGRLIVPDLCDIMAAAIAAVAAREEGMR
jgi:ADP-ribose pyrophosphatase YjhB (NUDIX family)